MFLKRQKKEINPDQISQSLTNKKPNRRRRIWKFIILGIFVVLVSLASWVGYSGWNAIKKVTSGSGNNSFWNFLTNRKPSKLSGEGENRINVLIIGMGGAGHPGGLLADTIMVASFKPGDKKAAFISIPRDLYVSIPGYGYGKINSAHSYGETHKSSTGGGPAVLKQVVSDVLGIPIHYYVRGDFSGFKEFVDKIGGINVNVKNDIYDSSYPKDNMSGYTTFYLKKGSQYLDGDTALKYARSRHSSSDFDRARRQQDILLAIKDKTMSAGILANPKKVVDLLGVLGTHVRTDMSIQDIERFVQILRDINEKNTKQIVLDNGPDGVLVSSSGSAGYYLKPRTGDFKEIQSIAQNVFQQGSGTSEGATIEIRNGTGQAGQALTVASLLKTFGYSATAYMQQVTSTAETVLYDYSGGKKTYTAEFLKKYFNARIEESNDTSTKDFVLILGSDYLTNKPSTN